MKDNQESSSSSSLNLAAIPPLTPLFILDPSFVMKTIFCSLFVCHQLLDLVGISDKEMTLLAAMYQDPQIKHKYFLSQQQQNLYFHHIKQQQNCFVSYC